MSDRQMKWWGWGAEGEYLDVSDKPYLWSFVEQVTGVSENSPKTPLPDVEKIDFPPQTLNRAYLTAIARDLRADQIKTDKMERLIHAYGKSFRDLLRMRLGIVEAAPDCVVYAESESDVEAAVKLAVEHDVVLIPFGGGSNIAGSLEVRGANGRMVVSLDMKRMDKVLEVDQNSFTARIQAGVLGPHMEEQLNAQGVTLGHFPDSFVYSTLGGWLATRSAGMQSDKYGKIEDMVLSLRMVTPIGTIVSRTVPKCSNGIEVNRVCIGSEGILGGITDAVMQVHKLPDCRASYGYLFPTFESGAAAIYECVKCECRPVVTRFSDLGKTALSFAFKRRPKGLKGIMTKAVMAYLKLKRFDQEKVCLMIATFEGDRKMYNYTRKRVNAIYRKHGAVNLGTSPGRAHERTKYDFPHIRDLCLDYHVMADVSETSTVWSNLLPLYYETMKSLREALSAVADPYFLGCHISHTYHTGASLYFTFGCRMQKGREIEQYLFIKKAVQDSFMRCGATLSHHHAVGVEHLPWVAADVSPTGLKAVGALKSGIDPNGVMNPGKIIPSESPLKDWGLSEESIANFRGASR